ncbi:MAG: pteridine reductase [Gammaproteobacteria bacterium]|nr:pteridine reductase [Gammaproteobacteria bacterium]
MALITGAAKRIGAVIVHALHDAGMNILLHYNASEDEAEKLCEQLNQKRKSSAIALHANLQEAESEKNLIQQAVNKWKRLDVLINNASKFYRTKFGEVTEYAWDDLMLSNLKAPFFLSQAAAPFLAQTRGLIINIADIHAMRPLRNYSVYCISKSGLVMTTKVLAKELGPHVRVNAIAPGSVLWPEGENSLSDEEKQKIIDHTLLLRHGTPEDIAKAVLFFALDGEYITGQVLAVDGGRMLFE